MRSPRAGVMSHTMQPKQPADCMLWLVAGLLHTCVCTHAARVMADRLGRPQGTPDNPVSTFVKTDVSSEPDVVHLLEHIKST